MHVRVHASQNKRHRTVTNRLLLDKAKLTTVMAIVKNQLQTAAGARESDGQLHRSLMHEIERLSESLGATQFELSAAAAKAHQLAMEKSQAQEAADEMAQKVAQLQNELEHEHQLHGQLLDMVDTSAPAPQPAPPPPQQSVPEEKGTEGDDAVSDEESDQVSPLLSETERTLSTLAESHETVKVVLLREGAAQRSSHCSGIG